MLERYSIILVAFALTSCGPQGQQPQDPSDAKSAAPANWVLPASGALSLTDLSNFAKQEREFIKVDDFAKGFDDSPLNGRMFAIEIDAPNYGGSSVTMIHWVYDADKGVLEISVDPSSSIQSRTDFGPKKKMSNAFGAEIEAETMETWEIKLGGDYDKPLGVFPKADPLHWINGGTHGYLSHAFPISPDQARQLTKGLRLRLEGKVVQHSGQTVYCGTSTNGATLTHPVESTTHNCTINVWYSRVSIVSQDGRTLREWIEKPQAAAAPNKKAPRPAPSDQELGEPMHDPYPDELEDSEEGGDPTVESAVPSQL